MTQTAAYFYPETAHESARVEMVILKEGRRQVVTVVLVKNKREARREAADLGFTPWNF